MTELDNSLHSLNVSVSKQKYSFPKSNRFSQPQQNICDTLYQLPSTKSSRATSLGYGNKTLGLQNKSFLPGVGTYTLKGQINPQMKKQQSFSFGIGRQKMEQGGPLGPIKFLGKIPAPGSYEIPQIKDIRAPGLKSRHPDYQFQRQAKNPGPGTYKLQDLGAKNYYINSRYKNDTNVKISQVSRKNNLQRHMNQVGPSDYKSIDTINRQGKYKQSKNASTASCVFSKSKRLGLCNNEQSKIPGPGQYNSFSMFG